MSDMQNPREVYGRTLVEIGRENPDVVVLEADLGKSIQLAENAYCPVWQMIRNNTEVIPEYEVCVPG